MTEVTDASLIAEALTDYYGPRCPDFEPECHCCKAWAQFDMLKLGADIIGWYYDKARDGFVGPNDEFHKALSLNEMRQRVEANLGPAALRSKSDAIIDKARRLTAPGAVTYVSLTSAAELLAVIAGLLAQLDALAASPARETFDPDSNNECEEAALAARPEPEGVEELVQERLDELDAEGSAFDRDCINAMKFLLRHHCGDGGVELLDHPDGWSADDAAQCIVEEIKRLSAEIASLKAKLAEAEWKYQDERTIVDRVWKDLGVNSYEDTGGKEISEMVREIKARLDASLAAAKYPAEAVIEGDNIVIRVPIAAIPVAFEAWPDAPRNDEADPLYRVTDAATFAKGIVRYLNDESEDGTTRIHLMLDSAMNEALEQGEEGVEEIAAIRARGGSDEG